MKELKHIVFGFLLLYWPALIYAGGVEYDAMVKEPEKQQKAFPALQQIYFEENAGQFSEDIKFKGSIANTHVRFLDNQVSFARTDEKIIDKDTILECTVWNLKFHHANRAKLVSHQRTPSKISYLKKNGNGELIGQVGRYKEIIYQELYDHADLRYYTDQNDNLKYDIILKPGFNIEDIVFEYEGVDQLTLDEQGNLRVLTPKGEFLDLAPFSYQVQDRSKSEIDISYKIIDQNTFGFEINGDYIREKEIILDPSTLVWGSYLNATTSGEFYESIDIDGSGNVIVGGGTNATNFPVTAGVYQLTNAGSRDATVSKISADGSTLIWSTYFGGDGSDNISDLDINSAGEIVFAGTSASTNLPTTASAFQSSPNSSQDAFIAKLSSDGTTLLASTYYGGSQSEIGMGVAVNSSGELLLVGTTYGSNDLVTTVGSVQPTNPGGTSRSGFICKFNAAATTQTYGSYFGGSNGEFITNIEVDGSDNIYIGGNTGSSDIPITGGSYQTSRAGFDDIIVAKLDPTGNTLIFSTYVGSTLFESGHGLSVASNGDVVFSGNTSSSSGFPTTVDAFQTSSGGSSDGIVGRISSDGTTLEYSSYIGGSGTYDEAYSCYVDDSDYIHLLGRTNSANFSTTADGYDLSYNSNTDLYYAVVHPDGSLHYSTFIGGTGDDRMNLRGKSVHPYQGHVYIACHTTSTDIPTTTGAYQETYVAADRALWISKFTNPAPFSAPPEICGNGIDDNGDGRIDEDLPAGISDNLLLWLRADVGFTGPTWEDQSANGNDATAYGDPSSVANSLNFNPGINFDGDDHVETNLPELVFENGNNSVAVFAVYKPSTAATTIGVFGNQGGGGIANIHISDGNYGQGSSLNTIPQAYGITPHLISYIIDEENNVGGGTNDSEIYHNGTLHTSFTFDENGAASVDNDFHIGKSGSNGASQFFQGDIQEIIVYYENDGSLAISDSQRQQIESYLAIKYGISLSHNYSDSQ